MATNDNKTKVYQVVLQNTADRIVQVDKGDYYQLQKAADYFLEKVQEISQLNYTILTKSSIASAISTIYQEMRRAEGFASQALQLQRIFEQNLNQFLGRTIYLSYVMETGDINFYDEANIGKIYKQATANRGRGNISASKMFDANDLQQELRKRIQASIANKKDVYAKALDRYNRNYEEDFDPTKTETGKAYKPSKNTFYWRLHDYHISGWTDPIPNKGWLAEKYADIVINEDQVDISNDRIELSLLNFWNFTQRTGIQDSIPASIKQDIVLNHNGSIQFAIKSGNFSTAMFGQFVRLAFNIKRIPQLTIEQFKAVLPKIIRLGSLSDKIVQACKNYSEQELEQELQKMGLKV